MFKLRTAVVIFYILCILFFGFHLIKHALKGPKTSQPASVETPMLSPPTSSALYMPGNVCIIEATTDATPASIVSYARECAKSHQSWLKEQGVATDDRPFSY